jgi:hypothetical protein
MTDYRLRNRDLLYADRKAEPLSWRTVAIFGAIGAVATLAVASHLTDNFNTLPPGFPAAAPVMTAQQAPPLIQFVSPAAAKPAR